jgi:hypothetical protein
VALTGGTSPTEGVAVGVAVGVRAGGVSSSCVPPPLAGVCGVAEGVTVGVGVLVAVVVAVGVLVAVAVTVGVLVAFGVGVLVGAGVLLHSRFEVSPPQGWQSVPPHANTCVAVAPRTSPSATTISAPRYFIEQSPS